MEPRFSDSTAYIVLLVLALVMSWASVFLTIFDK